MFPQTLLHRSYTSYICINIYLSRAAALYIFLSIRGRIREKHLCHFVCLSEKNCKNLYLINKKPHFSCDNQIKKAVHQDDSPFVRTGNQIADRQLIKKTTLFRCTLLKGREKRLATLSPSPSPLPHSANCLTLFVSLSIAFFSLLFFLFSLFPFFFSLFSFFFSLFSFFFSLFSFFFFLFSLFSFFFFLFSFFSFFFFLFSLFLPACLFACAYCVRTCVAITDQL